MTAKPLSRQPIPADDPLWNTPPGPAQLRRLIRLATASGRPFTRPTSWADADRQILQATARRATRHRQRRPRHH